MKGPLRRIRSRRPLDPSQQESQPTIVAPPQAPPAAPLPAGLAPEDVAPTRPSFRDRGRLRRRLRYLRRVRELGFRDLGGLAFDLHRFARRNDELVLGKLAALDAVDRELRAIERAIDERRDIIELREPGVAACPRCGALHGSDARFCPQCGTQFSGPLAMVEVGGTSATVSAVGGTASFDPAQEALPLSVTEQTSTPVSGALAGNPPPPAPPAPEPQPQAAEAPAADATPEQPAGEQATQVHQPVDANGNGHDEQQPGTQALTSGDPLAPREHPES
jgi:ribosomal protein L40E